VSLDVFTQFHLTNYQNEEKEILETVHSKKKFVLKCYQPLNADTLLMAKSAFWLGDKPL